jgi:excisionase family DNA binding protein
MSQAFTVETLAARWDCSGRHVRELIARRDLPCFRLGRLVRISRNAVEEFECRTNLSRPKLAAPAPAELAEAA